MTRRIKQAEATQPSALPAQTLIENPSAVVETAMTKGEVVLMGDDGRRYMTISYRRDPDSGA